MVRGRRRRFKLALASAFHAFSEVPQHSLLHIFCAGEIGSSNGGNVLLRSFTISEDFRNMDATIAVHLTSIDMLLSVKVDSRTRINSVSTIYTPGKMKTVSISIMKDLK